MTTKDIENIASDHFHSGLCCSESVFKAIAEASDPSAPEDIVKMASGFCGGVGGTHEEACGALTGGIMAIGYLFGRQRPDGVHEKAKDLATEFRKHFLEKFNGTQCAGLLDRLGDQPHDEKCRALTGEAAGLLWQILNKQ